MSAEDHFHHVRDFGHLELPFGNRIDLPKIQLPEFLGGEWQITKFMLLQVVAAVFVFFVFTRLGQKIRSGQPVKGRFWNFWEAIALFIRDEVVRPTIGDHSAGHHADHHGNVEVDGHGGHVIIEHSGQHGSNGHASHAIAYSHPADQYLPFVWSCFFYILICNLLGAIPFLGSATGEINVTGALAFSALCATFIFGTKAMGVQGFFGNLIPATGVPGAGGMLLGGMMFVIELLGFFIKHSVLAIRLFANIMGGHTVLGVILGFIAVAARPNVSNVIYGMVLPGSIIGQVFIGCLELFVAFLQAYVFAFLATIFIAGAVHKH